MVSDFKAALVQTPTMYLSKARGTCKKTTDPETIPQYTSKKTHGLCPVDTRPLKVNGKRCQLHGASSIQQLRSSMCVPSVNIWLTFKLMLCFDPHNANRCLCTNARFATCMCAETNERVIAYQVMHMYRTCLWHVAVRMPEITRTRQLYKPAPTFQARVRLLVLLVSV